MAVVSVINMQAWWPWTGWYNVVIKSKEWHHTASVISEVGVKNVPPGTISLVRKLLPQLSEDEANDWPVVLNTLELLDEHELYRVLYIGSQLGWAVPHRCVEPS